MGIKTNEKLSFTLPALRSLFFLKTNEQTKKLGQVRLMSYLCVCFFKNTENIQIEKAIKKYWDQEGGREGRLYSTPWSALNSCSSAIILLSCTASPPSDFQTSRTSLGSYSWVLLLPRECEKVRSGKGGVLQVPPTCDWRWALAMTRKVVQLAPSSTWGLGAGVFPKW